MRFLYIEFLVLAKADVGLDCSFDIYNDYYAAVDYSNSVDAVGVYQFEVVSLRILTHELNVLQHGL